MSQNLAIVLFSDHMSALAGLNDVTADSRAELLEIAPLGKKVLALLQGQVEHVKEVSCEKIRILPQFETNTLKAYYGLQNINLLKHVLIVESDFAGDLFFACDEALKAGLAIGEFRVPRTPSALSYLWITSDEEKKLKDLSLKFENISYRLVSNLNANLQKFLNVEA